MVSVFKDRKAVVLQWDVGDYEGPVTIRTSNPGNIKDVSSTELVSNPGYAAVSVPLDYEGAFNAEIVDDLGNVIDGPDEIVVD
jgi:hypothetical protein